MNNNPLLQYNKCNHSKWCCRYFKAWDEYSFRISEGATEDLLRIKYLNIINIIIISYLNIRIQEFCCIMILKGTSRVWISHWPLGYRFILCQHNLWSIWLRLISCLNHCIWWLTAIIMIPQQDSNKWTVDQMLIQIWFEIKGLLASIPFE